MLKSQIPAQSIKRWCRSIHNDDFLVIPAARAGILPKKKKKRDPTQKDRSQNISLGSELEQNRESLSNDLILGSEVQEFSKNIESLRPESPVVSAQEMHRLRQTLAKGYRNKQLSAYIKSKGHSSSPSHKKLKLVGTILERLWGVSSTGPEEMKHIIELSERDFILIIGHKGKSLREWAKSGASIKIDAANHKLHIQSSPQTFDWISASIHQIVNQLHVFEVDLTELSKQIELSSRDLMLIQYLSDTYLVHETDKLIIYSRDKKSRILAHRLLLQLVPASKWTSSSYLYDTNHEHISQSQFEQFYNLQGLPWMTRGENWFRWQQIRAQTTEAEAEYQWMDKVQFDTNTPQQGSLKELIVSQLTSVTKDRKISSVTATVGHLLHKVGENTVLPNAGMHKTFDTNVPLVRTLAGQLGDFHHDLVQDFDSEMQSAMDSALREVEKESELNEPLSEPLGEKEDLGDPVEPVHEELVEETQDKDLLALMKPKQTMKDKETGHSWNDFVLRVRLHPNCLVGAEALQQHPPIEVWVALQTIKEGKRARFSIDMDNTVAVAALHEHHSYVSLADSIGDLRFTATESEIVEDENLEEFVSKIKCDSNTVHYMPASVKIKGVEYAYIEHSQITRAELNYKNNLLQLFSSEDGKIGGYRTEANLVLQDVGAEQLEKFVEDSLDFVQQVESTPVAPIKL